AWLLVDFVGSGAAVAGGAGGVLLVIYWSLSLPAQGQEIAFLVQQYPAQRNVTLRLVEPLGAPEEQAPHPDPLPAGRGEGTTLHDAAAIAMSDVVVQAAGHVI